MNLNIRNGIEKRKLRHIQLVVITGFLSTLLVGTTAAQANSPSGVVSNAIDSVIGEAATIGSTLLFAYGFYQLINAGTSEEKSGPIKKVAVSWTLGIIVRTYQPFLDFVTTTTIRGTSELGTIGMVEMANQATLSAAVVATDIAITAV